MLSGLQYNIVRNAALVRVTQMRESIQDVLDSYTKLDDAQKENLKILLEQQQKTIDKETIER